MHWVHYAMSLKLVFRYYDIARRDCRPYSRSCRCIMRGQHEFKQSMSILKLSNGTDFACAIIITIFWPSPFGHSELWTVRNRCGKGLASKFQTASWRAFAKFCLFPESFFDIARNCVSKASTLHVFQNYEDSLPVHTLKALEPPVFLPFPTQSMLHTKLYWSEIGKWHKRKKSKAGHAANRWKKKLIHLPKSKPRSILSLMHPSKEIFEEQLTDTTVQYSSVGRSEDAMFSLSHHGSHVLRSLTLRHWFLYACWESGVWSN